MSTATCQLFDGVRGLFAALLCAVLLSPVAGQIASGQSRDQLRAQAESQLQQMTSQQIELKIKELGLTRQEAEGRARDLGIDLGTYLQQTQQSSPAKLPAVQPVADSLSRKQTTPPEAPVPIPVGPRGLPFFGYDIFTRVPNGFEPTAVGPVDPEYLIGPEDVLRITVWGQVEMQNELTVDREGKIFIPTIGQFLVSGTTLEKATQNLKKQMSRSYSGLLTQPPTVWLDLTLARLRPKRVFILGEVNKPGGYTVSSYASVFSSLYSVGGPTVNGSLRDVRIIRNNKIIAHVDLYDYLTGASETADVRVQNNDMIFVPKRGKTVAISREVRRPAVYELLPQEHLRRLLDVAGGVLSTAYLERVQVDRIVPFKERRPGSAERRVIDINFREINNAGKDYELYDGDEITVYAIFDMRLNVARVSGAVWRPGQYELDKVPTVRALILAAQGAHPRAYLDQAQLLRYNPDWTTQRIVPFNLRSVLYDSTADWKLEPRDEIVVFSMDATEIRDRYVTIRGEVKRPGRFVLHDGMRLADLLLQAGGYTEEAELLEANIARVQPGGLGGDTLTVILHSRLPSQFSFSAARSDSSVTGRSESGGLFLLQHRDEVVIKTNPRYRVQQNITVRGDFMYPGVYALSKKGERLSELLARAGGPTRTSYLGGAQFFREGKRLFLDFERAVSFGDALNDVALLVGDSIVVPPKPNTVLVDGEVNARGLFSFRDGDDVSDYVDRAGGRRDSADYAILTYPSGESRKVSFGFLRSDPGVPDGSQILVTKVNPPKEEKPVDIGATIRDTFAILTSAATVAFLIWQTTK